MFPLSEIFPEQDYRFHLTLRKGDLADFFIPSDPVVLAERRRWLADDPYRYAAGAESTAPIVEEIETTARERWGKLLSLGHSDNTVAGRMAILGAALDPDILILSKDGAGVFRLCAGALCFPTFWSLTEKLGRTLDEIHGVVPGLNSALQVTITQFLQKLKPGTAYERSNWGLVATPELNLHVRLDRPRLSLPFHSEQIWVRIEDQILAALPSTGGIVFGIRLRVLPLRQFMGDPMLRTGLRRALRTMSEPLIAYKGITEIRDALLEFIEGDDFIDHEG